eukprot:3677674-Amphidinium_carterae.1
MACSTLAESAQATVGTLCDRDQGRDEVSVPRPRSILRVFGESHPSSACNSARVQGNSDSLTKNDLLAFQEALMLSFSAQYGQNIQAIDTRLDVIDLDKVALEG